MRTKLVLFGVLCSIPMVLPAGADLDLGTPMGTPLDWEQELHQPVPTGIGHGKPADKARVQDPLKTQLQGPKVKPPAMGFTSVNLYNFLRVRTHDIMTHFKVEIPKRTGKPVGVPAEPPTFRTGDSAGGTPKKPKDRPQKLEPGIQSNYTPPIPGELAWIGIANCLRTLLHPEVVSIPEIIAYLVEIGDPSLVGANSVKTNIAGRLKSLIRDIPPNPPKFPSGGDPITRMLTKVAVLELVGGYPHALDPTYCRRTLSMGEMSYEAVLKCAKSDHPFLAANAVVVLANYPGKKVTKELEALFKSAKDPTMAVRILAGFARRKDKAAIPLLLDLANSREDYIRAMAVYALGHIAAGDSKVARKLAKMAARAGDDELWTILPALARIADQSAQTRSEVSALYKKLWAAGSRIPHPPPKVPKPIDFRSPQPEPKGYKKRILADFAEIAAAACGDSGARQAVIAKLNGGGIKAFTDASWILLAETLPLLGTAGQEHAKRLATNNEIAVAMTAVKSMAKAKTPDLKWVKEFAMGGGNPLVRAAALTVLWKHTVGDILDACHHIVKSYSGGSAEEAYLVGMAIQMLDRKKQNKADELIPVVEAARASNAVARRNAENEYDITQARIDVSPPLLEIATLALGATGDPKAIPVLLSLLESSPAASQAALALGGMPLEGENFNKVIGTLIDALADPKDGWLRWCAYLALKNLTKQDYFTDWIFGSASSIYAAQDRYRSWFEKNKK